MAESFLHLIKICETRAMTFPECQNIGMSVRGDIKIWHGFAFRLTWTGVNTFYVCLNVSLSALYQPTERTATLEFTIEMLARDAERFELTKAGLANICSAIDIQCYQLGRDVP